MKSKHHGAVIAYHWALSFEERYDGQIAVGLADDMALLLARAISSYRSIVGAAVPCNIGWELLTTLEGSFLFFAAQELPNQSLWTVTAGSIIAHGTARSIETHSSRRPIIDQCITRRDIDYRFLGLGL